jgi:hypothetical protein
MMEILLEECSPDTPISEKVMCPLVSNLTYGADIMNLLL